MLSLKEWTVLIAAMKDHESFRKDLHCKQEPAHCHPQVPATTAARTHANPLVGIRHFNAALGRVLPSVSREASNLV